MVIIFQVLLIKIISFLQHLDLMIIVVVVIRIA